MRGGPVEQVKRIRDKKLRELAVIAIRQKKWTSKVKKKHVWLLSPDGQDTVSFPCTPSDHRTYENKRHDLRRAGVQC
ncbi:hypothetical protein PIS_105 [Saccharomonospora phage PIS 136]|nr:hypothetical protein PIS_105 [Saccharomonospora phage PIS 136]